MTCNLYIGDVVEWTSTQVQKPAGSAMSSLQAQTTGVAGAEVKWHDLKVQPADLLEQDIGGERVVKSSTELS